MARQFNILIQLTLASLSVHIGCAHLSYRADLAPAGPNPSSTQADSPEPRMRAQRVVRSLGPEEIPPGFHDEDHAKPHAGALAADTGQVSQPSKSGRHALQPMRDAPSLDSRPATAAGESKQPAAEMAKTEAGSPKTESGKRVEVACTDPVISKGITFPSVFPLIVTPFRGVCFQAWNRLQGFGEMLGPPPVSKDPIPRRRFLPLPTEPVFHRSAY